MALDVAGDLLNLVGALVVPIPRSTAGGHSAQVGSLSLIAVLNLAAQPVAALAVFFGVAYFAAYAMPPLGTTIQTRVDHVLRPWALAFVPDRALTLIMAAIGTVHVLVSHSHQSLPAIANLPLLALSIAYSITLAVNALSVGTGLRRWLAFWVYVVAFIFVGLVFALVTTIISRVI